MPSRPVPCRSSNVQVYCITETSKPSCGKGVSRMCSSNVQVYCITETRESLTVPTSLLSSSNVQVYCITETRQGVHPLAWFRVPVTSKFTVLLKLLTTAPDWCRSSCSSNVQVYCITETHVRARHGWGRSRFQ